MRLLLQVSFAVFCFVNATAQQTVGVLVHELEAYPGYTLFTPSSSQNTFLIDNCGRVVHQWHSMFTPAESVYLMADGSLLRTAHINSTFTGGGSGGRIERWSWEGELSWAYNYSSASFHQHHDIEPLPNGNVLVLAWETKTRSEAILFGRNPATAPASGLWPDHLVELMPMGTNDAEIVWEWHAWDHLVQDFDSTKNGFGNVADHPELINVNYAASGQPMTDWIHCNAVDYNPELDQVLISAHNFNEIWIIDHSTTMLESAGHSGGTYGRGGDLLYRWGNPEAYGRGTSSDRIFNGQHDARWVPSGLPGEGQISVFNNNHGLGQNGYSSVDYVQPEMDSLGHYVLSQGQAFGPQSLSWTYDGLPNNKFYSNRLSGAQRLPNGNTLVCVGNAGQFFEVTQDGSLVWVYVNPVSFNNPVSQGSHPSNNTVFRAERFPVNFQAFDGRDLTPGDPIELNPLPLICPDTVSGVENALTSFSFEVFPNPIGSEMTIHNPDGRSLRINIFAAGQKIQHLSCDNENLELGTGNWPPGLIIMVVNDMTSSGAMVMKLLKL